MSKCLKKRHFWLNFDLICFKSVTLYFLSPHLSLIAKKVRYFKREMNYLRLIIFFITIWNLTRYVRKLSSGCKGRNSQLKCEAGVGRSSQLWLCICRLQNIFDRLKGCVNLKNILSFFSVQENFDFRTTSLEFQVSTWIKISIFSWVDSGTESRQFRKSWQWLQK